MYLWKDEGGDPPEADEWEGVGEAAQPRQQVQEDRQLTRGVEVLRQYQASHLTEQSWEDCRECRLCMLIVSYMLYVMAKILNVTAYLG